MYGCHLKVWPLHEIACSPTYKWVAVRRQTPDHKKRSSYAGRLDRLNNSQPTTALIRKADETGSKEYAIRDAEEYAAAHRLEIHRESITALPE